MSPFLIHVLDKLLFQKNRAELLQHDFHIVITFSTERSFTPEENYISTISTPSIRATVIKSLSPRPETVAIIIWSLDIVGASFVT